MHVLCPVCHESFPIAAGFLESDGKRLAVLLADMEPALGRAVLGYLRLFKPAKQSLRTARAVKLVAELDAMAREGSVCRDERAGVRRPTTPAMWVEGIEQVLQQADRLTLPLQNHHYLRAIVFGIADQIDASAERRREADARAGRSRQPADDARQRRLALNDALHRHKADFDLGLIDADEYRRRVGEARRVFEADDA